MSLHAPLRALLLSWSSVTSLMTPNPESADYPIRPERLHQSDPLPAIEIAQPKETFEDDLDGAQNATESDVIISVISTDVTEANAIGDAIRSAIAGFTGLAGSVYLDGVHIKEILRGYAPMPDGSDSGEYVVAIHCQIWTRS